MSKDYVHLHVHSHYSLLGALPKIGQILDQVKEQGGDAVALTDNGAMYGVIEFYKKAQKAGIKPIIGMDAYLAPHGHQQRRGKVDAKANRIVLLAENDIGYKNLIKLSSIGFLEGFYYRPRIDKELLREYKEGLIALTAGAYGEIPSLIKDYGKEKAQEALKEYVDIFGPEHFFLELVDRPELPEQESVNATMIELGHEMNIPLVACKDSFYLHPEDRQAWKILQCVRGGKTLEDYERMNQFDFDASLIAPETMIERFKDIPEAIANTRKIADRCNVEIELGVWHFPPVDIPEGDTADTLLRKNTYDMAGEKYPEPLSDEVKTRIDYELDIIKFKEYSGYFLSVADYTKWARDNAVVTTTRGSAAGSIVSYIVGISSIDPLEYQLPFERFLNPERPSAPDVDADFADNQRDRVLKYVTEKYGKDKVAQICTFGTMLARGSVRDVGRALGHPYAFIDQIAKQVPMGQQGMSMTLKRAMKENPELKQMYDADGRVRQVIDTARQIEGCARHVSVHAAGVVISPGPLTDYTPLQIDTREGKVITQYEMHAVEDAGLVKMDFLGIRNLSILGDAIKIVSKTKGVDVDIENIPVDDKVTFDLLAKGHTMGVFQLSGDGMTKYLVELKPTRVEDIMAMVALYRPGPIEFIPEYIKRKHNPELIDYPHELLVEILEKSLGLLIYQDDVMLTAIKLAGYSWLEADLFRKAMGKKIPELMLEQEKKFKGGCVENKIPKALANDLWERIKPFAMYAFNKSHASSYGMVAYQTAYMKANFPAEYMASLMTAESADLEKVAAAVQECSRMGIKVLPPDINESLKTFTYIDDNTVRFGLLVIKNLGSEVIETMIEERKTNGPFVDLVDFASRISHRAFNKKSLEAMIKAGALDRFGNRNMLLQNAEQILNFNRETIREKEQNQTSLFDLAPDLEKSKLRLKEYPRAPKNEYLAWEKEYLGLYITNHPYSDQAKALEGYVINCNQVEQQQVNKHIRIAGMISICKRITTKKGDPMAFLTLQDMTETTEVIVFPRTLKEFDHLLYDGNTVLISAKVNEREGEKSLISNSIIQLTDDDIEEIVNMLDSGNWIIDDKPSAPPPPSEFSDPPQPTQPPSPQEPSESTTSGISVKLRGKPSHEMIAELRDVFQSSPGRERVYFLVESAGQYRRVETDYTVENTPNLIQALNNIVGRENVEVEGR
jgi:DNA polymerase III subunit alpha